MMELQVTEKGKQLVSSSEFAEFIRAELNKKLANGSEPGDVSLFAFTLIAWALTGRDVEQPPRTTDEQTAFFIFIEKERSTIRKIADEIGKRLFRAEFGDVIN